MAASAVKETPQLSLEEENRNEDLDLATYIENYRECDDQLKGLKSQRKVIKQAEKDKKDALKKVIEHLKVDMTKPQKIRCGFAVILVEPAGESISTTRTPNPRVKITIEQPKK